MAVKDVKKYYLDVQHDYLKMISMAEQLEKEYLDNKVNEDVINAVRDKLGLLKENYKRISYIMYLLSLPQRDIKKSTFNKQHKELAATFKDNIVDLEDKFILTELESYLKNKGDK